MLRNVRGVSQVKTRIWTKILLWDRSGLYLINYFDILAYDVAIHQVATAEHSSKAVEELKEARESQKSGQKWLIGILIGAALVSAIIILFLWHPLSHFSFPRIVHFSQICLVNPDNDALYFRWLIAAG